MAVNELCAIDAVHVSTVLEDCVDQLIILGRVMPVTFIERDDAAKMVKDEIAELIDYQMHLEKDFARVVVKQFEGRWAGAGDSTPSVLPTIQDIQNTTKELRNNVVSLARTMKQSPLTTDNLEKVQSDRAFLEIVLHETKMQLTRRGTFEPLTDAVFKEKEKRRKLEEIILKEEAGRKRVRQLQKRLVEVKKEREREVQIRNEMIAHLKDQLQEMKAKTNMEKKYVKKVADVSIAQTQKKCKLTEDKTKAEIEAYKLKIDEENRVNAEVESYLRTHIEQRGELLQHWMEKYEVDVEDKTMQLDLLKAAKAKDLARLIELTRIYAEYEQVVVDDRIEKEKIRRKLEQEKLELKIAIKIQSWWRGIMVRRCLGQYKIKKKKKEKGGSKKKK